MSHTINVADLTDQDAVHRVLSDIQNHGACYSLVQDGMEVAKVVPAEEKTFDPNAKISPESAKRRRNVMERVKILRKKIAEAWSTDETAAEAVANNRREL